MQIKKEQIKKENVLKILGLILGAVVIWYNTNVYLAHQIGRLTNEWYIIFLLVPLFVLIINYVIVTKILSKHQISK